MSDEAAYRARMLPLLREGLANIDANLSDAWRKLEKASSGHDTRFSPRHVSAYKAEVDRLTAGRKELQDRIDLYTLEGSYLWLR